MFDDEEVQKRLATEFLSLLCAADLVQSDSLDPEGARSVDFVVWQLIPDRVVFFDAEAIYDDADYSRLILKFAAATDGEWQPELCTSRRGREGAVANIEFFFRNQHFKFDVPDDGSDWVADEFYEAIRSFAESELSGTFVCIPGKGQESQYVYLPRSSAAKLEKLIRDAGGHC